MYMMIYLLLRAYIYYVSGGISGVWLGLPSGGAGSVKGVLDGLETDFASSLKA